MAADPTPDPNATEEQLRAHGWRVLIEEGDGHTWAALVAIENPDVIVRRYGRGEDESAAIDRAWQRYRVEQIGGPPED